MMHRLCSKLQRTFISVEGDALLWFLRLFELRFLSKG
jgi:hypothetical protein